MFEVEQGIPTPKVTAQAKYPFRAMDVGESFFVSDDQNVTGRLSVAACQFGRRNPDFKFVVRSVDGGYRCWRVK